ncbi:unnamed protein product [Caenorhabditis auriculariae]|uniref:RRM domain-containing protein n=1 Tax=Caenorhabditis auriculariae TaxID=2777116 RepID=A0A8S1HAP6_9PELO|nr:unnamed protein product [Caenorhabditis auriculariae]
MLRRRFFVLYYFFRFEHLVHLALVIEIMPSPPATVRVSTVEPPEFSSNRLFVCNLPFRFKDDDLMSMFKKFSPVCAEIAYNERGSRGFGFVTLASVEQAEKARTNFNRLVIDGRVIEIRRATAIKNVRENRVPRNNEPSAVYFNTELSKSAFNIPFGNMGAPSQPIVDFGPPNPAPVLTPLVVAQLQLLQAAQLQASLAPEALQNLLQQTQIQNLQAAGLIPSPAAAALAQFGAANAQLLHPFMQTNPFFAGSPQQQASLSASTAPYLAAATPATIPSVSQLATMLICQQQIQLQHNQIKSQTPFQGFPGSCVENVLMSQGEVENSQILSSNQCRQVLAWKLNATPEKVSPFLVEKYATTPLLANCIMTDYNNEHNPLRANVSVFSSPVYREHCNLIAQENMRIIGLKLPSELDATYKESEEAKSMRKRNRANEIMMNREEFEPTSVAENQKSPVDVESQGPLENIQIRTDFNHNEPLGKRPKTDS